MVRHPVWSVIRSRHVKDIVSIIKFHYMKTQNGCTVYSVCYTYIKRIVFKNVYMCTHTYNNKINKTIPTDGNCKIF